MSQIATDPTFLTYENAQVRTIPELLAARIAASPDKIAYTDAREAVSWREFGRRADALALSLVDLGLEPHDAVGVMGQTTGEWGTIDQGILAAGGRSVGIYSTLTPDQVAYILNDCGAKIVAVGSLEELEIVKEAQKKSPTLETLIAWGNAEGHGDGVRDYSALVREGLKKLDDTGDVIATRKRDLDPHETALLVYTSGTTGTPKGAMLSHWNCGFELKTVEHLLPAGLDTDRTISFLPMAHVAEHVIGFYGRINTGISTYFVGSLDSQDVLSAVDREKPTIFGSVPRIFEKAYAKIQMRVSEANARRQAIFRWAERQSHAMSKHRQERSTPPLGLRLQHGIADKLVFKKIRDAFGGQVKFFLSGAAPIDTEILEFFNGAGMLVLEAYGLTECTGISAINRLDDYRLGTVGPPLPGTEIRLADDGEILLRGPNVFKGYLNKPEATKEVLDSDGWLRTGDIGEIDDGRWLRITDRKKNLIITSGGKNVAPASIEAQLTSEPILGPVLIVGDQRPYLTALVTLDPEEARTLPGQQDADLGELASDVDIQQRVRQAFEAANGTLAGYEQVRRFKILDRELTIADGELTPTLKVRRKVVAERCASEIDQLYDSAVGGAVVEVRPPARDMGRVQN